MVSLYSIADLTRDDLHRLVDRSIEFWHDIHAHDRPLAGMVTGSLFLKTSTRTRTAFAAGAARLGADVVTYGPSDLQLNTGESIEDTGRMLASMLDLLVVRTDARLNQLVALSDGGRLPVINAMCAEEHPTQAISDLATIQRHLQRLDGIKFLYVGEGNNTARALARALAHFDGVEATFWTPVGYELPLDLVYECNAMAANAHGSVKQLSGETDDLPAAVDIVYTTRWQTTGTSKADPAWREKFRPYYVDSTFISRWPDAVLMHDLPAHRGDEISGEVLEGPQSIAWDQGAMKMRSAMAVLEWASL